MTAGKIQRFPLNELPAFQRFQKANPNNPNIDALQTAIMYGRAIHWISFLDVIWPDFEKINYFDVEVAYLVVNDSDDDILPPAFYRYVAQMLAMFWEMQLAQKYPDGDWEVIFHDDNEVSVSAEIFSRN